MLQPLEGLQLHPHGTSSPGAKGWMGTITVGSKPSEPPATKVSLWAQLVLASPGGKKTGGGEWVILCVSCCGSPRMRHLLCDDALGALTPSPSLDIQAGFTLQFSSQPSSPLSLLTLPQATQGSTFPVALPIHLKTHLSGWVAQLLPPSMRHPNPSTWDLQAPFTCLCTRNLSQPWVCVRFYRR